MRKTIVIRAIKPYTITLNLSRNKHGWGGSIETDMQEPEDMERDTEIVLSRAKFNAAIEGIESVILGHACAGLDVAAKAYIEGIRTALEAIGNEHS